MISPDRNYRDVINLLFIWPVLFYSNILESEKILGQKILDVPGKSTKWRAVASKRNVVSVGKRGKITNRRGEGGGGVKPQNLKVTRMSAIARITRFQSLRPSGFNFLRSC